jgi:hypothetical protein
MRSQSGPVTNFSFSLKLSLDSCVFVILWRPLWREDGSVIYCCYLASPEHCISVVSPAELNTIFYCPNFLDSPNLENQVPVFIFPRDKVAELYPRALGTLSVASYGSQGCGGGIRTFFNTGWPDWILSLHNLGADPIETQIPTVPLLSLLSPVLWSFSCRVVIIFMKLLIYLWAESDLRITVWATVIWLICKELVMKYCGRLHCKLI